MLSEGPYACLKDWPILLWSVACALGRRPVSLLSVLSSMCSILTWLVQMSNPIKNTRRNYNPRLLAHMERLLGSAQLEKRTDSPSNPCSWSLLHCLSPGRQGVCFEASICLLASCRDIMHFRLSICIRHSSRTGMGKSKVVSVVMCWLASRVVVIRKAHSISIPKKNMIITIFRPFWLH